MSESNTNAINRLKQAFSAGLGPKARAASWIVAIAGAVRCELEQIHYHCQVATCIHCFQIVPASVEHRDFGYTWKTKITESCFQNKKQANGIKTRKVILKSDAN
jgi:hypothetical protein